MKKTIWKFPVAVARKQTISMPTEAEILTIQMQRGVPCLWAICDSMNVNRTRIIQMMGTGFDIDQPLGDYIGTIQLKDNTVWHYFDGGEE